jgi:K+-sensing histidine kinase KdpD
VTVDVDLVTRPIENIFDNAFRYTPRGGMIEVELREVGPDIEIRIGNSGSAIPMGARNTIFEKYRQVGSERLQMNRGLGLYFCRLAGRRPESKLGRGGFPDRRADVCGLGGLFPPHP